MLRFVFISLLCCFQWLVLPAAGLNFTHVTVKDGLLNSTVYFTMQDSKGFIWFCTETGVNRYDGRQFESFTIREGLADNEIFKCYEDKKGRIWFLSYNGQLSYYFKGKIYNKQTTPALTYKDNGAFLVDCVEDQNGTIWFNTSLSDVLKVTDTFTSIIPSPVPEKQRNNYFFSSKLFTSDNTVRKLTQLQDKVYELDLSTMKLTFIDLFSNVSNAPKFRPNLNNRKNNLYFFAANTLVRYSGGRFEALDRNMFKTETKVMSFLEEDSVWWIGTAGDGVVKIDCNTARKAEPDHFLEGQSVTSILKDIEGNYWFTTHGNGVFLFKNDANKIASIPSGPIYGLAIIKEGRYKQMYAGGDHGNVNIYQGGHLIKTINLTGSKLNRIHELFQPDSTTVCLFTDGPLMFTYNFKSKSLTASEVQQGYKAGSTDTSGNLWICTHEIIWKAHNNLLQKINIGGAPGKIQALAVVSDSLLYVGASNQLYKVVNGNAPKIIVSDSILKTGVTDLKITENFLWAATHGNGIFLIRHDSVIKHISTENGLVADVCQKLYDDKKKFIWLATNNGISVINRNDGSLFYNLSISGGLISDDVKNICSDNDTIFIATSAGVNIFKLSDLLHYNTPPKVYITAFKSDEQQITDPPDTVSFCYYKGFISIHFTALSYEAPLDNKYEYKFVNDKEWQKTKTADISLFSLPPGLHKLLFRARKYNSTWSEPIAFTIIVKPLWYQSLWFYYFTGCVFILLMYFLFTRRIKHLRKLADEQYRYEKQISELESKSLAYQMNPHFIFNSLNTVQQFILKKDVRQSLDYLSEFSKLMRQILENSKKASVLLSEEIDFLNRYLDLEKIRYSNKFTYAIHLDKDLLKEDIKIPPMLFQPLLENAVKHGVSSVDNGHISLDIKVTNDILIGRVEDNGLGFYSIKRTFSGSLNKESTALKVLEERVKLIKGANGQTGSFKITDKSQINKQGTIIELIIPLNIKP